MTKKNNKKGFTLAELLVVVAIIAVLVAVSIPIFTAQLRKARLATNQANARAAKAEAVAEYLVNEKNIDLTDGTTLVYDAHTGTVTTHLAAGAGTPIITTAIEKWEVDNVASTAGEKLGDKTFYTWTVCVNADGSIAGYVAAE